MLSTTYVKASISDITPLPINHSNIIFQEVCYFDKSTLSSSLMGNFLRGFEQDRRENIPVSGRILRMIVVL